MSSRIGTHTLTGGGNREYIYRDKRIGTGAYSVVYKGILRQTKESVAIKKIDLRRFKNCRERIDEEIAIMKKMNHIGIVQLYDVIYDNINDYVYIVMEYCSGGDLSEAIHTHTKKNKKFSENEIRGYFRQLAEAFGYLFKQRILHRDVKPQNILFKDTDHRVLKLTDFGFSKYYNEDNSLLETLCGSPMYMAPEILFHQKYNMKTDLWSIGVILYELIYNRYPYKANNTIELIKQVKRYDVKIDPTVNVSLECLDLLRQLLTRDPIKRIGWKEFFNHPWLKNETVEMDLNEQEYDIIPSHIAVKKSKPVPIATDLDNYLIDDYCISNDDDESLVLDTRRGTSVEKEVPAKSNILEYMNISMELIKSLTKMSFKSI